MDGVEIKKNSGKEKVFVPFFGLSEFQLGFSVSPIYGVI